MTTTPNISLEKLQEAIKIHLFDIYISDETLEKWIIRLGEIKDELTKDRKTNYMLLIRRMLYDDYHKNNILNEKKKKKFAGFRDNYYNEKLVKILCEYIEVPHIELYDPRNDYLNEIMGDPYLFAAWCEKWDIMN